MLSCSPVLPLARQKVVPTERSGTRQLRDYKSRSPPMEGASSGLSAPEKVFLQEGIATNCREDGRSNLELRVIRLTKNPLPTELGSVQVSNGESNVIVGVRAELVAPELSRPEDGKVFVNVSFSSPADVDRRLAILGEDHVGYGLTLASTILSLSFTEEIFPRRLLCVRSGVYVWHLYIDLIVLGIGGSLVDIASLGVVAALRQFALPEIDIVADMGVETVLGAEIATPEDANVRAFRFVINEKKPKRAIPGVLQIPLIVSIGIIGNSAVADLTQEESYAMSHVVYGAILETEKGAEKARTRSYQIAGLLKSGGSPLPLQTLSSINLRLINVAKGIFGNFLATPDRI